MIQFLSQLERFRRKNCYLPAMAPNAVTHNTGGQLFWMDVTSAMAFATEVIEHCQSSPSGTHTIVSTHGIVSGRTGLKLEASPAG
jgi:hypothetical protein